ncbi:hypothetical protein NDU88_005556 [Pleurodeles waltl]|uniref:Uncharacterized protein n=1 Tax=Pleurodeles waltl TaxID=8319 RepID=A0AAV7LLH2_PLEWA|nr:hypothetical protein NDU88_005556 [Pleurodeles waltl]
MSISSGSPGQGSRGRQTRPRKSQAGHTRVDGAACLPPPTGTGPAGDTGGPRLAGSSCSTSGSAALGTPAPAKTGSAPHDPAPPSMGWRAPYRYGGLRISSERVCGPPGPHSSGPPGPHDSKRPPRPVTGTPGRAHTGRRPVSFSPRGQGKSESREARAQQAARAHLLLRVRSLGPSSADHKQINPARPCLHADGLESPYVCRGLCVLLVLQSSRGSGFWQIFGGP